MILLQVKDMSKSYGTEIVFQDVSFVVDENDKVGLVGPNGAGKTTLFRCITGEEAPDEGETTLSDKVVMGYLQQIPEYVDEITLFDAVMEAFTDILKLRDQMRKLEFQMGQVAGNDLEKVMENYSRITEEYERAGGNGCESTARKLLKGLGFSDADMNRNINEFSGGEKTKANLARLLAGEPDLLLLDEPTNHLDLASVEWLENYLKSYTGSLVIISHDRYFLDQVTNKTLELEHGKLEHYPGNYSRYLVLKQERTAAHWKAYEKQQKEIKATEEYINKYRAGIKSKQARGRQSKLNRLERIDVPKTSSSINIKNMANQIKPSGNVVLSVTDLGFGFNDKYLFENVSFEINYGEKVGLVGANGTGKSTLLKLIMHKYDPVKGSFNIGSRVKVGYFDQEHGGLDFTKTVIEELLYNFTMSEEEARNKLGAFLFQGDDVFKPVKELSGGEKGRLAFLKIILECPNFLILDEPTNYLDIISKEVIEEFLKEYPGTLLTVSHDRYFLDKLINRTLELEGNRINNYPGNYSYYKEKNAQSLNEQLLKEKVDKNKKPPKVNDDVKPKINKAKTREKISNLEKEIEVMEKRHQELADLLADSSTYQDENTAKDYVEEYKKLEEKIALTYEEWEKLIELIS